MVRGRKNLAIPAALKLPKFKLLSLLTQREDIIVTGRLNPNFVNQRK
jgi:hypothetical protein